MRYEVRAKGQRAISPGTIYKRLSRLPVALYLLPCYFLASLLFTYPLVLALGSVLSDPVDPPLNTWILAWIHHALLTQPLELLNANIFYPYSHTLLYSETLLLPGVILLPVSVATGNPILIHNLFVLLGFTFTGGSGYLLGRWLFRNHWSGLMLGGVLAFNSYTLSNVAQAQLLHFTWVPLALLYVGRVLHQPRPRAALFLALFVAAQFYTAVYYGLFGFLVVGLAGGLGWLLKRFPSARTRGYALGWLIGSALLALLLCLPLALPYANLSQTQDLVRTQDDIWPFSASLEMWLTPPPQNLLYAGWMGNELPRLGFYPVDALFPGLVLLLLAASGLLLWLWHASNLGAAARYPLALLLGIGFFFLLSLGPHPQIKTLQPDFDQVLPYAWLHQWAPGFQALRAPGRFAILVFLGLGIAAGYLLTQLRWRGLQLALILLLLMDSLALPLHEFYLPVIEPDRRAAYAWLATQPETVYLELPVSSHSLGGAASRWLESQWGSILHWQRTPAGYSGFWPPRHDDLLLLVSQFPEAEATRFLQALGVEWILLHRDRLPATQWQAIEVAIQAHGWETQQWESVWAVHLPATETPRPEQTYAIPDRAQMGGELTLGAIFTSRQPTPILPDSPLGRLRAEWWQADERVLVAQQTYQPPFFVDPVAVSPVSIPVPGSPGLYTLRLYTPRDEDPLATAGVTVIADVAPPEPTLVPLASEGAEIICSAGQAQVQVQMRTIGWYEEPFTLSVRVLDGRNTEVARSAADVEFPPHRPRSNLLATHPYTLPLTLVPPPGQGPLTLEAIAYRWQQNAERTVPRHFVTAGGAVAHTLQIPLAESSTCTAVKPHP